MTLIPVRIWRHIHNFRVKFQRPPFTPGFRSIASLAYHFEKHGARFGCADMPAYMEAADRFCGGRISQDTVLCFRSHDCARVMYNEVTGEFAFVHADGRIGSYLLQPVVDKGRRFFVNKCNT